MTRDQRRKRRSHQCRKRCFHTQEEANKDIPAIKILNDSKGKSERNKGLHSYYCDRCDAWHVGHRAKFEYYERKRIQRLQ